MMDLKIGNETIGMVLAIKRRPEAQKMMSIALDGTPYAQTTGRAIRKYVINCFCGTNEDRTKLDDACNEGALVTVITRDNTEVTGYIEEITLEWKEWIDGHGVTKFTLIQGE